MTASSADPSPLLNALETLFQVPCEYWSPDTSAAVAEQLLGCSTATLDELTAHGLPHRILDGETWYDQCDLFNLALYSGSGATPPEMSFRFALRWMSSPLDDLLVRRSWSFRADISCPQPDTCRGNAESTFAVPIPELYGGSIAVEPNEGASPVVDSDGLLHSVTDDGALSLQASLRLGGDHAAILSPEIREIYSAFLGSGPRWVKLPPALHIEVDLLEAHGVATCVSASLYLERELRRAGLNVRTRRGWVLGMLDLVHAWVEVLDSDGTVRVIDPIFGLFSAMLPNANPLLSDPNISIRSNRVLPTGRSAAQPIARHRCGGAESAPKTRLRIAPVPLPEAQSPNGVPI